MSLYLNNEQLGHQSVHLKHFAVSPSFFEYQDRLIINFDEKLVLQVSEIR